jgi:polysaccharide biosynthesis/export protein
MVVVVVAGAALGHASAQQCKSVWPWRHCDSLTNTTSADPDPPMTTVAPPDSYVIGLEETLRISVWQEPELSATLPVRPDGKISLPLLNDVQASGLTPMELASSITEKLRKYVDDPRVTVVVSQMKARRVFMIGEVLRHGPLNLTPNMTVLQALATAGLTPFANTKKIYVLRVENGVEKRYPVNYKPMIKGKGQSQNILLRPEDMVIVP